MAGVATGFDAGQIFTSDQELVPRSAASLQPSDARAKFLNFIRNFRDGNVFTYRDQLRANYVLRKYQLEVQLEHLKAYDEALADTLVEAPAEYVEQFELAAKDAAKQIFAPGGSGGALPDDDPLAAGKEGAAGGVGGGLGGAGAAGGSPAIADIQVMLQTTSVPIQLRDLMSVHISRLVFIRGIVISASRTRAKAAGIVVRCRTCADEQLLKGRLGFSGIVVPRKCLRARQGQGDDCGLDPYLIVADKSDYVDQQTLKLQESPEDVPTGEMPRQVLLSVDRNLVDKVVPGTRVALAGEYTTFSGATRRSRSAGLPSPYVRVIGMRIDEDGTGRASTSFTPEEEEELRAISEQPNIYNHIADSIDPAIFGHEDIKKAIACLLFGGARKQLPDGMRLRGDINVLLLGDPGTGKSQFLKFVEKVAPIAVYTSGKGSSAAGLTASVIKDPSSREFYLEAGAMVLADGGVVCIDEFDKMREEDRVAIHEAMEQQTISIAKAGITTILNSRTSVLAAANPVFGKYDETKSAAEQIDFRGTILSRFDLIFIVRDQKNEANDRRIAQHVISIHKSLEIERTVGDLPIPLLKKYVAYARSKVSPRLSQAAADSLANQYVNIRSSVREAARQSGQMATFPITVRQLEAIVRIAESLAKMELATVAEPRHVDEALRLFRVSTLDAAESGHLDMGPISEEEKVALENCERHLAKILPLGHTAPLQRIETQLVQAGYKEYTIRRAIGASISRGAYEHTNQRRMLRRVRS
ncbi:MCM5 minichromosome maintenance deficient 5 [Thecamonas trahens ATCC 50062]|uniref:DNA replication licensing factor MCM5 n=1 Tax=Thecamonas trahens ATCC 50062 TaxID=461836 RepID=A0A0L0DEA0_THETB|nr:MCM5 minichromosome maintenance deficient 5 [Thecamonas trahens ATCC 50062]KNC50614.1 MCM5 minichromosome maintenance deficient 5 [Thecamonas trahens ATCC 50062]|eukprot:XP_013762501.1 MCM5 minichromosome maintenance deficient 5 [Thecamonas trahens ATCC 50062]